MEHTRQRQLRIMNSYLLQMAKQAQHDVPVLLVYFQDKKLITSQNADTIKGQAGEFDKSYKLFTILKDKHCDNPTLIPTIREALQEILLEQLARRLNDEQDGQE